MLIRIGISLILCVFCLAQPATAQSDLATMCESWNQCNAKMTEKFTALDGGDVTPGLADEYRDLVDEANALIKSMRTQGLKELKENPGDGKVIRALLAIMVHDAGAGRESMVLDVGQKLIEARINPKYFVVASQADELELKQKHVFDELETRHSEAVADDLPRVKITTSAGEFVIELYENEAPNTVRNFVSLVESGYYSDKLFHRVIENFMAQGGGFETEGIGSGGPGYKIDCECKEAGARLNFPGTISMAHAGPDTGGSQFFLNFNYNDSLDRKHTVFGRIVSGMDVLDKLERTEVTVNGLERPIKEANPDRIVSAEVVRKRDHSYRVRKKGEPELPEEPKEMPKLELEDESADEPEKEDAKPEMKEDAKPEMKEEAKAEEKADAEKTEEADVEKSEKPDESEAAKETKSGESKSKEEGDSKGDDDEDKS